MYKLENIEFYLLAQTVLRRCAVYAETGSFMPYIELAAAVGVAALEVAEGPCQIDISKILDLGLLRA